MPLYNNNKLFGIVMRNNRENVYILPIIYVLKSISKSDCNIYMFETDDIKQIGRYKIYENMIFSPEFNYYIKQSLLVKNKIALDKIDVIYSHQQSFRQSSNFLNTFCSNKFDELI